jgi:Cu+-exporting ATPase
MHEGQTYYFCCPHCLDRFRADPGQFLGGSPNAHSAAAHDQDAAQYFCPMHPEVVSATPGFCPKCGMALEPQLPSSDAPDHEFIEMNRRLWVAIVLAIPIWLAMVIEMLPGVHGHAWLSMGAVNAIQLVLTTLIVFACGWPFFQRAWQSVKSRSPNMFTLIALGVGAAYFYSIASTLAPTQLAEGVTYYESAATITVLVLLGQVLELRARRHTNGAIRRLLDLAPKTARRLLDDREEEVPLADVRPGDRLRIRPGERVPVDGTVLEGESHIDESMISGEPMPVGKHLGDAVIGGTLNGNGALIMRAERVGSDTVMANIVRMLAEVQRTRAPVQRLADIVSQYFVYFVMAVSLVTFVGWSLWNPPQGMLQGFVAAVAVLVIACPCALGLATPLAIMVGTGKGALSGILVREASALEVLEKADTVIVDKTGTLTMGKPGVVAIETIEGMDANEMLRLAAALEKASEHPLARALLDEAKNRGLILPDASGFEASSGQGVRGVVENRRVAIGNASLISSLPIPAFRRLEGWRQSGATIVFVTIDDRVCSFVAIADSIRPTSQQAVTRVKNSGLHILMLTGDSEAAARHVAAQLGIDEVIAGVRPDDKLEVVRRLQNQGKKIIMAGDGINDAPALAQAEVGVALATGTDIAIESADITLVHGDLLGLVRALALGRETMRTVRQNLFLAFVYNSVSIPIAAFGLLSPVWASAAMSLSSLSVVGNSLRLNWSKFE